jgi:hypothetical protein
MRFDPATSLLAGMDTSVLQAQLQAAQQAYLDLSTGAKGETYSYTQGDGAKSVTFTRANLSQLVMLIRQLQQQLGVIPHARRAIGVRF